MISSLWLLSEQRVPCSGPRRLLPLCERAVHLALAVVGLGTVFLPYAAAQVAESTPPPRGFVNAADTGQSSSSPKRPAVVLTPEMRGDIYMAEKKFREAAEVYRDNSKGSAVMLNKTGIAYHQMLQLNVAERYYRLALHTDPKYSEAVNNLGTIYYAKKSYRRAINQYKKALRMHPDTASVWSNLAMGYFSRGDEAHVTQGHILSFDNRINTGSGTIRARARFDNADGRLIAGMYVSVRMGAGMLDEALLVPESAIGNDQSKRFVFVVDANNKAEYRAVELGPQVEGSRVVRVGVKAGERLILDHLQRLAPGVAVDPQPGRTASN